MATLHAVLVATEMSFAVETMEDVLAKQEVKVLVAIPKVTHVVEHVLLTSRMTPVAMEISRTTGDHGTGRCFVGCCRHNGNNAGNVRG
jgi:formyltetrahydrofolate hydrolase